MGLLIGLAAFTVQAQQNKEPELVTVDLGADHFAAGQNVDVAKTVAGDLLAAGREIVVGGKVGGDAAAAGGTVRLDGNIADNVYAAGGQVFVNGTIARNARLAGGSVEIAPASRIEGGVSIAAGQARVNGSIGGYLQSAGGSLYIDGPIGGDVDAAAGQIELGPNTRINGRLRYRSRSVLKQDAGAQVLGGIEQIRVSAGAPAARRGVGFLFWIWTVGLMLLVAILFLLLPGFGHVIAMVEKRPGASALLGFAMLICIPIGSLILLITLIGAPLGLLSMAAYFALLLVGYVAAAAAVGDWLLKRVRHGATVEQVRWRIVAALCGIFVIAILGRIPFLGGLIVFVALIMGIGAVGLQTTSMLRPAAH